MKSDPDKISLNQQEIKQEQLNKIINSNGLTLREELEQIKRLGELSAYNRDDDDLFNNFDTDDIYNQMFATHRKKYEPIKYTTELWAKVLPENKKILAQWIFDIRSRKLRDTTIEQYWGDSKLITLYLLLYLDNIKFTEVTRKQWKGYLLYLIDTAVSNARVNRLLSVVKSILNFLEESDEYPEYQYSTATKIQSIPKEPRRNIVFIGNEDFMTLYNYLMKEKRYKEATLIALAYESAGRKNELAQVKADTVRKNCNATNIVVGKRGKLFPLIYFDLTLKAKEKYMETREDDNPSLFVNSAGETMNGNGIYITIVKLREDFKMLTGKELNFNVHSFRHSALENYNNGTHEVCQKKNIGNISIEKLKHISHHSSIEVCNSYLKDKSQTELEKLFGIKFE